MYPHERSLVKRLEKEPFVLVGMNSDTSPEKYRDAAKRESLTWPSFFDGGGTGGPIATKWGGSSWPTTFVLDADGIIRYRDLRGEAMDNAVDALLKEMKGK